MAPQNWERKEERRIKGRCDYRRMSEKFSIADFEDGRRGPWGKECEQPLEAGKDNEMEYPLQPPEREIALPMLRFSQWHPCWNFDLLNCKIRHLHFLNPQSLWQLVTVENWKWAYSPISSVSFHLFLCETMFAL